MNWLNPVICYRKCKVGIRVLFCVLFCVFFGTFFFVVVVVLNGFYFIRALPRLLAEKLKDLKFDIQKKDKYIWDILGHLYNFYCFFHC